MKEEAIKKVKDLQEGMEFKSYRELCNYLEEPILSSNSKKSQLKEWNQYFHFYQPEKTNKYIIEHINQSKKTKQDNRSKWYGDVSNYILNMLSCIKSSYFQTTKSDLIRSCGFGNYNFSIMDIKKDFPLYHKYTDDEERLHLLDGYQKIVYTKLNYIISSTLRSMKKKGLIFYTSLYLVNKDNETSERDATIDEVELIEKLSKEVMKKYGINYIGNIDSSMKQKYYDARESILKKNGFNNVSKVIRIIPGTKFNPNEEYPYMNKYSMNEKILPCLSELLTKKAPQELLPTYLELLKFMNDIRTK